MKTHSLNCQNPQQIGQAIQRLREDSFAPNLAIVFCSVRQDIELIRTIFTEMEVDLIGCTTAGEIVNSNLHEESIAVLLLAIDSNSYEISLAKHDGNNTYAAALTLGQKAKDSFENPGMLLMSGGLTIDAEQVINGVRDGVKRDIPIYGGLAGDDLEMIRTLVFTNHDISDHAIATLTIDTDKIQVQGLAISGWEPIGGINEITEAEGNVIYKINGESAYQVFMRYFGFDEDPNSEEKLINIQTNYPLQLFKGNGQAVLRSPMVVDKAKGSITLTSSVQTGDKFRFSNSPGFEIIEQTISEFDKFQQKSAEADAIILFSCKGRHGAFGPMLEDEIDGIYKQWKKPMIGFLSYGEFGDDGQGRCEFHNETCSLVLLNEK